MYTLPVFITYTPNLPRLTPDLPDLSTLTPTPQHPNLPLTYPPLPPQVSFDAPDKEGEAVVITDDYVRQRVSQMLLSTDLRKYIL